ncbi:hypothetical protein RB601_007155 [Gaeumannomyces tritici]
MLRYLFSARESAPQPPSEPQEPTLELEPDTPAAAIPTTGRKRKASDAVPTNHDGPSLSQRPAQRRRLVEGDQIFPQRPPSEGSCHSEDGQPASSSLTTPPTESTRAPKPNTGTTVEYEANIIQTTKKRSPAKLKARPAPTSDSEADGHRTQSSTDDDKQLLPRKARLSVDLSPPTHTDDQCAISFDDAETRYGFASQSPPSHTQATVYDFATQSPPNHTQATVYDFPSQSPPSRTQATVRSPVARRGRPHKPPQEELADDQSDSESREYDPLSTGVRQRTPGKQQADDAFESSHLAAPQKSNNKDDEEEQDCQLEDNEEEQDRQLEDDEEEQDGHLEDDDGQVAIIESNSDPEAIPIILNEDVTDKKFTISSIVDHRRDADIDHAFELSVRWVNFAEPSWESERSIQAQVPELLYKYWESVGGRPITGAFRVFSVLRHWSARPLRVDSRGPQPKKRTKYLVQWEGYSADPQHTSVETREKLRDIAPRELDLYLEHVREQRQAK